MANRYWVGGSGTWDATNTTHWSATSGGAGGASVPTIADAVIVDAASGSSVTITLSSAAGALNCASLVASAATSATLTGGADLTCAGRFDWSGTNAVLNLTSGTLTFTTTTNDNFNTPASGLGVINNLTIVNNTSTGVTTLNPNNLTVTQTITLTSGTLGVAASLYCKNFSSSNTNIRSLGSFGNLYISGNNGTVYDVTTSTNFTNTSTTINFTYTGSVGTRTISGPVYTPSVNGTGATDTVSFTGPITGGLTFTGFTGTWANTSLSITGGLTLSSGMTAQAGANTVTLLGTTSLLTNGVFLDFPLTCGAASVITLTSALSLGSTRTLTISGTSFTVGAVGYYNITAGNIAWTAGTLTISYATVTLTGTGSVWTATSVSALTNSLSKILLSSTSTLARTFAGGGKSYNYVSIGGSTGTSTTTFTGANTFTRLDSTKTVAHTLVFPSATTTTIKSFAITGTIGNVVTIQSSVAASAAVLNSSGGTQSNINYLSVKDINGTTATNWYMGANSTNVSGNTNLTFSTCTGLYWVGGSATWGTTTTNWSLTSGGAGSAGVPGPNCDANFTSLSGTSPTITLNAAGALSCRNLTVSSVNGTITFSGTGDVSVYQSLTFSSAANSIVWSGTTTLSMISYSGDTLLTTSSALSGSFACPIVINNMNGVKTSLGNALNTTGGFTLATGTFSVAGFTSTSTAFTVSASSFRILDFSLGGNFTINGTAPTITVNGTNLTVLGTSAINVSAGSGTSGSISCTNGNGSTEANAMNYNCGYIFINRNCK